MIGKGLYLFDDKKINMGVIILLSSFIGGYMVSDFPKPFLNIFTTPIGQFIAIFIINLAIRKKYNSTILFWIFIECIISVFCLQSLKYILRSIYSKTDQEDTILE
jgi:hypothetical protein